MRAKVAKEAQLLSFSSGIPTSDTTYLLKKSRNEKVIVQDRTANRKPAILTTRFYNVVKDELRKINIRDLWMVACILFTFFRDINFWGNHSERKRLKIRSESLTQEMCRYAQSGSNEFSSDGVQINASRINVARTENRLRDCEPNPMKG